MNIKLKYAIILLIVVGFIVGLHLIFDHKNPAKSIVAGNTNYSVYFTTHSTAVPVAARTVVHDGGTRLVGVLFGQDTSNGAVAIYDLDETVSSSDSNPVASFSGSTLHGYYPLGIDMVHGISATVTNQLGTWFVWGNP